MEDFSRATFADRDAAEAAARVVEAPDPSDPRSRYRMGMCAAMAIALHERTGLPLGLIGGAQDGPRGRTIEFAHAVVRLPDGRIMDVDGAWRMDRMVPVEGCFATPVDEIRLVEATREDVQNAFDPKTATPEFVAEASAFIDSDGDLLAEAEAAMAKGPTP